MASGADSHAVVAGAGTPPSDSPRTANKAGGAAPWKPLASEAVPVVVAVGDPIIDADSWPALPGLASPPPPPAAKASLKAPPSPSTRSVMSPVSLGNPGALDANPENEAPVGSPAARRALMMPSGDALEKSIPSPELSPAYVPNARGTGGVRGRRSCMCSPTNHPGSFRCSLHKERRTPGGHVHHHKPTSPPSPTGSSRLGAAASRRMGSALVRIGAVEGGEWARRALAATARPCPAAQHRRRVGGFRPRPSRLSAVSVAGDRAGDNEQ